MAGLQHLPNEVLEKVMTHVRYLRYNSIGEYDDLRALCLVSQRFADIARRVLYYDIRISCHSPDRHPRTRLQCLVATVLTVPRVAAYVRSVRLSYVPEHLQREVLGSEVCTEVEQSAKSKAASEFVSGAAGVVTRQALLDPDHPLNPSLVALELVCPDITIANVVNAAVDQARLGIGQEWIEAIRGGELTPLVALLLAYVPKLEVLHLATDFSSHHFLQTAISAKSQLLCNSKRHGANLSEVTLDSYNLDYTGVIAAFARLASVRSLEIIRCVQRFHWSEYECYMDLGRSCLRSLKIYNCGFNGFYLANLLRDCGSLQLLHIQNTHLFANEADNITYLRDALRHATTRSLQTLKISNLYGLTTDAGSWGSFRKFTQLENLYVMSYGFLNNDPSVSALTTALPQHIVSVSLELACEEDVGNLWPQIREVLAVRQYGVLKRLERLEIVADKRHSMWDDDALESRPTWNDDTLTSLEKTHRELKGDFDASGVELRLTMIEKRDSRV